jgi:O-antigen ligase
VREVPTGIGPGNFNRAAGGGPVSGDDHSAHNDYLGMLAERSVVGFAGWIGLLAGLFFAITRLRGASAAGYHPLATDQLYGLLGALAVHAIVIEMSHFRHFWMVFAVVIAAAKQAEWYVGWEAEPVAALRPAMLEETA